jgi:hypothetical protein
MVNSTDYRAMAAEHHQYAGMCRSPESRERHLGLEQELLALADLEETDGAKLWLQLPPARPALDSWRGPPASRCPGPICRLGLRSAGNMVRGLHPLRACRSRCAARLFAARQQAARLS